MAVVLDTNIIISGLYSKRGASYQLLKAALSGQLTIAVSPLMAFEYEGVIHQRIDEGFLKVSKLDCARLLDALFSEAQIIWEPLRVRPVLTDVSDDKILECAISANCSHIITFNMKHFPSAFTAPFGIEVMPAGKFLLYWRSKL